MAISQGLVERLIEPADSPRGLALLRGAVAIDACEGPVAGARRERDGLERAGGRAPAIESRLSLLDEGRELTRRALAETEAELAALRARLE